MQGDVRRSPPGRLARWFELGAAEADRMLPMEGLRGLAVLLVFFVHYGSQLGHALGHPQPPLGIALQQLGHAGVDLFFVLSGYLIYRMLLGRARPYAGFLARRVQRLYPTFLVVLALHLGLALASASGGGLPPGGWPLAELVLANLLLLPGLFAIQPIVIVAWSLSYEMAFYLVMPPLVAALRLRGWPPAARVTAMLGAVAVMLATDWEHGRMGMFACGMLLVEAMPALRALGRRGAALDMAAFAAVGGCGVVLLAGPGGQASFLVLFAAGFLLPAAAFAAAGPVARGLSWRPLRWLGNMSYSYYLAHGLVLDLAFRALRLLTPGLAGLGDAVWWLLLVPAFLATLAGSAVLFLLVERPYSILPADAARRPAPTVGMVAAE
ncbi:acyltransferase family protein [Dankookia sp. GCM10030260]|uniref:acyltransferase family protein n=1 Tax=Dankookia sp. GCM10030260 TaxID=3273390 RepID=UPI00360770E8